MKAFTTFLIICLTSFTTICRGQTDIKKSEKDTVKQMNLLDEQVKMFEQIFELGGNSGKNPVGMATDYLELIEKMEMSENEKRQYREIYELYDTSLDPGRKEELKIKIDKMLNEAMDRGLIEN